MSVSNLILNKNMQDTLICPSCRTKYAKKPQTGHCSCGCHLITIEKTKMVKTVELEQPSNWKKPFIQHESFVEIDKLNAQLLKTGSLLTEINELNTELNASKSEIGLLLTEIGRLNIELDTIKREKDKLLAETERLDTELHTSKVENNQLKNQINTNYFMFFTTMCLIIILLFILYKQIGVL
jgi:hypothetical protein